MSQKEFHGLYELMPEGFRAELIDGIVYVREPVSRMHGDSHVRFGSLCDAYQAATPGVQVFADATVILGEQDEVQPDVLMRICPNKKGQSTDTDKYIGGPPELVAEVAYSTRSIDLHVKRKRYAKAGVIECVVICLEPLQIHWFDLRHDTKLVADEDGIFRSVVFPGLWLHRNGMLQSNYQLAMDVLNQGLASPEHLAFCRCLANI